MSKFSISISTLHFLPLILFHLLILTLFPTLSISTSATKIDPKNFDPQIALLGDAKVSNDGSLVQLTSPSAVSSTGLLVFKNPFKFAAKMPSFSTEFSFSFTGNHIGLSLFMGSYDFASEIMGQAQFVDLSEKIHLGIDFVAKMDSIVGDFAASFVNVSVSNVNYIKLVINSGEKLKSWVDYDGSSKRLEVRLAKVGDKRPYNPMIVCDIDLFKLWGENEFYVGLGSLNRNFSETFVYSWRFRLSKVFDWMHSFPADPHGYVDKRDEDLTVHKRRFCPIAVLGRMIFATGCGALLAFALLFSWAVFVSRRNVFPIGGMQTADFRYEKINVVVDNDRKVVKN